MRPTEPDTEEKLYECFECGQRVTDPETKDCDNCGSELRRIDAARDL